VVAARSASTNAAVERTAEPRAIAGAQIGRKKPYSDPDLSLNPFLGGALASIGGTPHDDARQSGTPEPTTK
jgi:hypothetical protein